MMHETDIEIDTPKTRVVDIWLTRLSDVNDELRNAYRQLLNPAEAERFKRFLVHDARDQFLVARVLLRTVLSRYVDVPCQAWSFATNAYGKPHIDAPECGRDLKFNVSHANGLVACAVSRDYELGVDVENTQRDLDHLALAPGVFAKTEVLELMQLPPHKQRQYFYSLWTLKEAYIKARGMGLSLPLDAFWFDLADTVTRVQFSERCPDTPSRWQFVRADPTAEHKLALAIATLPNQPISARMHWIVPLAHEKTSIYAAGMSHPIAS